MNGLSLLDSFFGDNVFPIQNYRNCSPKVDVVQKKDCYELFIDLPGKTEKDVEITLKDDVLTIGSIQKATDAKEQNEEDVTYLLQERYAESIQFKRTFTLPKDIDSSSVQATFKNGILTVHIGRKADAEAKKILIQAE